MNGVGLMNLLHLGKGPSEPASETSMLQSERMCSSSNVLCITMHRGQCCNLHKAKARRIPFREIERTRLIEMLGISR